jgi:hypothetical protein
MDQEFRASNLAMAGNNYFSIREFPDYLIDCPGILNQIAIGNIPEIV